MVTRKVSYTWARKKVVPYIRFSGEQLAEIGLPVGTQFVAEFAPGRITLWAVRECAPLPDNVIAFEQAKARLDEVLVA